MALGMQQLLCTTQAVVIQQVPSRYILHILYHTSKEIMHDTGKVIVVIRSYELDHQNQDRLVSGRYQRVEFRLYTDALSAVFRSAEAYIPITSK